MPVVYSHRAAVPPTEAPPGASLPLPPPGSLAALSVIPGCRYDIDVFQDAAGELVVGHPAEIVQRLGFPSEERIATITHEELRALDPQITTLREFMGAWARKCHHSERRRRARRLGSGGGGSSSGGDSGGGDRGGGGGGGASRRLGETGEATSLELLIEPKTHSATTRTVALIAAMAIEFSIPSGVIGVWSGQRALAIEATASGLLTPLYPVKTSTPQGVLPKCQNAKMPKCQNAKMPKSLV